VCGQHHSPATFIPGKDPVPIVQEAGWTPEPVWIGAENFAPPGFDPRTFQPVASRYTDYAIPAPSSSSSSSSSSTGGGMVAAADTQYRIIFLLISKDVHHYVGENMRFVRVWCLYYSPPSIRFFKQIGGQVWPQTETDI
jgi:hypothetical protein